MHNNITFLDLIPKCEYHRIAALHNIFRVCKSLPTIQISGTLNGNQKNYMGIIIMVYELSKVDFLFV